MHRITAVLFFLLSISVTGHSQTEISKSELVRKNDTMFFAGKPFTGKAVKRKSLGELAPIVAEEWYTNGIPDGNWKEWYVTGEKKFEGAVKNGKNDGEWIEWNKDGTIKRKLTFNNGLLIENKD